jgi:methionyl-tRNA formyltransferase
MRIAFMGTPDFAATALAALRAAGHELVCVYTQPPRPAHRGKQLSPSPVQRLAEAHSLPVRTPVSLRDAEAQAAFAALSLDLAVVAAYGLILPQAILDAPRFGCLNIHASLLPRWRGAAPIHRAIMAGDAQTGICIMQMEAGLDTGPVLLRETMAVAPDDTTASLHDRLATMGGQLCVTALAGYAALVPTPQPAEGMTYAHKIDKAEARLDFSKSADELERLVRALNPFPGAWLEVGGERIKILRAKNNIHADMIEPGMIEPGMIVDAQFNIACGHHTSLRPMLLQRAGKQPINIDDFLHGFTVPVDAILA